MKRFSNYTAEKEEWITFIGSDFFPDNLVAATERYVPLIAHFGELLHGAKTTQDLYLLIMKEPQNRRIQLLRIFRKYVSPDTSVEMLKRAGKAQEHVKHFGPRFREIELVRERFASRSHPDEALVALLREYEDRGEKGYSLTEAFFEWFEATFGDKFLLEGPVRAGKDVDLKDVLPGYPKSRPVDFVIRDKKTNTPLAIGFARYDTDRGGAQEDDRPGGYGNAVTEILSYAASEGLSLKIVFLNDGPGLLLGSMWRDYGDIESRGDGRVLVVTLKMLSERLTEVWIRG